MDNGNEGEEAVQKIRIMLVCGNGKGSRRGSSSSSSSSSSFCQADECDVNLNMAKSYNRRHKVCERHSKAPVVLVSSIRQRFCQQCSKRFIQEIHRRIHRRLSLVSASNRSNFSSNNVYLSYYIEIFVVESRVGSINPSLVCTNLFILFDNVFLALADSVISQNLMRPKEVAGKHWLSIMNVEEKLAQKCP
ncbi:Transcription factor [Vigna unguiculata]|uniref:Transcription factor n=1 Tax=Vigna unguiculata TaxID=3917 RepID=A0A4D6LT93_VIGUN|nr:Transcription factor [Vigna unguiculata]